MARAPRLSPSVSLGPHLRLFVVIGSIFAVAVLGVRAAGAASSNITNTPPVLVQTPPPSISVNLNEDAVFALGATDPDTEQRLTFSLDPPLPFVTVTTDPTVPGVGATGQLQIEAGSSAVGEWCVSVTVSDGDAVASSNLCIAVRSTSGNIPMAGFWPGRVNMATRELATDPGVDLDLGGPLRLSFGRYYGSELERDGVTGSFGPNWRGTFDWKMTIDGTDAMITTDEGEQLLFSNVMFVTAAQQSHFHEKLKISTVGPYHRLQRGRKSKAYDFDTSTGLLHRILDESGNSLTCTYSTGLLATVSDGLGRVLTFGHDPVGRITSVTDGMRTVTYAYDGTGRLSSVTDAGGGTTLYGYATGAIPALLVSATHPAGNTPLTYTYDADGRVASACDADANCWSFADTPGPGSTMSPPASSTWTASHDDAFRLTSLQNALSETTTWTYDASGRPASRTTTLGHTTALTYDLASGFPAVLTLPDLSTAQLQWTPVSLPEFDVFRISQTTNPDASVETFGYDAAGNPTTYIDAESNTWSATYNARGQMLTYTNPSAGVTSFGYDAFARLQSRTEPPSQTTGFGYDALHRLSSVTHPDLTVRTLSYDANNQLTAWTDETGETWSSPVDGNGRRISLTDPLLHTTTYGYDVMDRMTTETDPLGGARLYGYDGLGRLASFTDRTGHTTTYGYDASGSLTSVTDPLGNQTAYAYDADGRCIAATDPLLHTTAFAYDARDLISSLTDPLMNTTSFSYDAMERVTRVAPPLGPPRIYEYDARGLLVRAQSLGVEVEWRYGVSGTLEEIEDANHNVWTYASDPRLRPISRTDPLGRTTGLLYDARGRVWQATSPEGTRTLLYDGAGRLTSQQFSGGLTLTYVYDAAGRLTSADGVTFVYDDADRIVESNGMPAILDAEGRVTSVTYAPGKSVTHTYDVRGLLASTQDWLGGTTTFLHDGAGRTTSITRPNGVTTTSSYDAAGRLISKTDADPGSAGPPVASVVTTRDALGRIATRTREAPVLATPNAGSLAFAYDAASEVSAYAYDGLGRLVSDGATTYEWDGASRLIRYAAGADSPRFTYDAFGNNLTRSIADPVSGRTWDYGSNRSGKANLTRMTDGTHEHFYVQTPSGMPLHRIDELGTSPPSRHFYHFDESGNTVCITSEGGDVVTMYDHSPTSTTAAVGLTEGNHFTHRGATGAVAEGNLVLDDAEVYEGVRGRCISCPAAPVANLGDIVTPYIYSAFTGKRFLPAGQSRPVPRLLPLDIPKIDDRHYRSGPAAPSPQIWGLQAAETSSQQHGPGKAQDRLRSAGPVTDWPLEGADRSLLGPSEIFQLSAAIAGKKRPRSKSDESLDDDWLPGSIQQAPLLDKGAETIKRVKIGMNME